MFEFTENERFRDIEHVKRIVAAYRKHGFLTALDDFGPGFAGLSLLANFQPDLIKIDMDVLRGIDTDTRRRSIVGGIAGIARSLGIAVLRRASRTRRTGSGPGVGHQFGPGLPFRPSPHRSPPPGREPSAPPHRAGGLMDRRRLARSSRWRQPYFG